MRLDSPLAEGRVLNAERKAPEPGVGAIHFLYGPGALRSASMHPTGLSSVEVRDAHVPAVQ